MPNKSARAASDFLAHAIAACPAKVTMVLTDNGKAFNDRSSATTERAPTGQPPFDHRCAEQHIEHRPIKPCPPQTNAMVEGFT